MGIARRIVRSAAPGELMVLIIGIGNPFRRDDGIGPTVAGRIAALGLPGVEVRLESGEGTKLMQSWAGQDEVIVIDAVRSGEQPGRVHVLEAHHVPVPTAYFHYSSHAFGLAEAIEVGRVLGELPPRLIVIGVEGRDFASGSGLSPELDAVVPLVAETIHGLIRSGNIGATVMPKRGN